MLESKSKTIAFGERDAESEYGINPIEPVQASL